MVILIVTSITIMFVLLIALTFRLANLKNISIEEINIIFEQLKQIGDGMICFNYANAKKYNLK